MSTRLRPGQSEPALPPAPSRPPVGASLWPGSSTAQALLEVLLSSGPTSRTALAAVLGVSRARLTELSRAFLDQGLLLESTAGPRQGKGRPFVHLSLDARYGYCLGASVTDSRVHLVLTDLAGEVHGEQTAATSDSPQALARILQGGLEEVLRESGIPRKRVLGIGLSISGFVDRGRGVVLHSANLGWHDVPVAELVEQATGVATFLDNDANAAATSEKLYGLAREARNFALITLGQSIGGAHYVAGQLYRGSHGGAGEIAHTTAVPGGLACLCGKRGCLDTVASRSALLSAAQQGGLDVSHVGELERLAAQGVVLAADILQRGSEALGLVIAAVVQSNEPELVLIADASGFGPGLFLKGVRQTIENNILPRFLRTTRIEIHSVADNFWARGAASMATHQVLGQFG